MAELVVVRGLTVTHSSSAGPVPILSTVDLDVAPGESVAVIGESGSGKSTLALALAGFLRPGLRVHAGTVTVAGTDVFAAAESERRRLRRNRIAVVPQNAGAALTPSMRIGAQLAESLSDPVRPRDPQVRAEAVRLLGLVRLPRPEEIVDRYPHELSGGQQQRVGIALALAGRPDLLILDEPTTGLDVVTQAAILDLLAQLRSELGFASVLVSHDLGVVAAMTDRTSVLHGGRVLEAGPTAELLREPGHPYTRALLSAIPRLHRPGLPVGLPGVAAAPAPLAAGQAAAPQMSAEELLGFRALAEASAEGFRPAGTFSGFGAPALDVVDLEIDHRPRGRRRGTGPTVSGVSFQVRRGEIVALVGESGSGKSSIASAVAGLITPTAGRIVLHGPEKDDDLLAPVRRRSRELRRQVQMIFQNADTSLNPRRTVADAVDRPLRLFSRLRGEALVQERNRLLGSVGLRTGLTSRLPGQLSGGQRQRVGIARALAPEPELVLADEVVSALDVSVQASVLRLIDDTRREKQLAYLFIGHDLAVVRGLADRVIVLDKGRVVEDGPVEAVFGGAGNHPVTAALLAAVLEPDPDHAGPADPATVTLALPDGLEFATVGDDRLDHGEMVWVEPVAGHRIRCRRVDARRSSPTSV